MVSCVDAVVTAVVDEAPLKGGLYRVEQRRERCSILKLIAGSLSDRIISGIDVSYTSNSSLRKTLKHYFDNLWAYV